MLFYCRRLDVLFLKVFLDPLVRRWETIERQMQDSSLMVDGLITQPCKSQWLGNLAWRRGLLRILARRIAIQSGTNYQLPEEDSDGRIFCSAQTIFRLHDIQQFCTCLSTIFQGLETCNFLCSPWYQLDSSPWVGHKHPRLQAFDSNPATQKCVFRRPKLEISIGQCRNQIRWWNMMKRCLTCASLDAFPRIQILVESLVELELGEHLHLPGICSEMVETIYGWYISLCSWFIDRRYRDT